MIFMVHCALFNTALYILARTWITMITRIDLLFLHSCVLNSPWCPKLMLRCAILSTNCVNLSRCWSACLQGRRIGKKNSRVFSRIWTYDLAHICQMIYQWVGCQNMTLFSKGHTYMRVHVKIISKILVQIIQKENPFLKW